MAEINIERKRGVSPLVWILLLIVLGAIGWFGYNTYMKGGISTNVPAATTSRILQGVSTPRTT